MKKCFYISLQQQKSFRSKKATLHAYRCAVETLLEETDSEKDNVDSELYDCKFIPVRVDITGILSPNSDLESSACKIQSNSTMLMTEAEKLSSRA